MQLHLSIYVYSIRLLFYFFLSFISFGKKKKKCQGQDNTQTLNNI